MSFLYHNFHKANKKYEILSKHKYCFIKLNILLFFNLFIKVYVYIISSYAQTIQSIVLCQSPFEYSTLFENF